MLLSLNTDSKRMFGKNRSREPSRFLSKPQVKIYKINATGSDTLSDIPSRNFTR